MRSPGRYILGIVLVGLGQFPWGCARKSTTIGPASQPVVPLAETQPAPSNEMGVATIPRNPTSASPTTRPTSRPASQPASKPAPKFVVISLGPDGKERRWIAVEKWTEGLRTGRVIGRWAGPNKMIIDAQGAEQVVLKLSKLPIQSGRRIVLHIEDARMELKRSLLPTVRLRRSPTGAWSAVK